MKDFDGLNDQIMALSAVRYCLGRHTYVVPIAIEWVNQHWNEFNGNTQGVMVRDIIEFLHDSKNHPTAFSSTDDKAWAELARYTYKLLTNEQQQWVRLAVSHRGLWPLEEE